jgi:hypothetical protein
LTNHFSDGTLVVFDRLVCSMDRTNAEFPARLPVLGWREWVALPDFGIPRIKAKVDTGARSSSLHAFDIETFDRDGRTFVRFAVHPRQHSAAPTVTVEAEVLDFRTVRSSSGKATRRFVIITHVSLMGHTWPIELTLANRDAMGFRMLLGREAIRGRMLVDPGRSYSGGRPKKRRKKTPPSPGTGPSVTPDRPSSPHPDDPHATEPLE